MSGLCHSILRSITQNDAYIDNSEIIKPDTKSPSSDKIPIQNHDSDPEKAVVKELPLHPFKKAVLLPVDELQAEIKDNLFRKSYDSELLQSQ